MKVLIVDDIEINRKLLRVHLQAEGLETCEAADGIGALAAMESEQADAIISDILMPRMDGYCLCREVRKSEAFRDAPFIFYTGTYTAAGDEKLALDCGGDRYFRKPAPIREILAALREVSALAPGRGAGFAGAGEPQVLREYNEALVRKLERRITELDQARIEIEQANEALEARVRERTAQLLMANEQLDAFNHVLVHHLRSPLAAISGFSELLLDRCADKLSGSALSHLRFVSEAAARMNGRATNLLRLARANRAKITIEPVNLSALAQAAMGDLIAREPKRACAWDVLPGLVIHADVSLMRVALMNLLENAWKHTRGIAAPRIEFGLVQDTDEPIFFVRDNGDGFNQETADRLFNPDSHFQQPSVLPTAGIGLRTVRRIITRLGGRVWAEGAVGRGATFYFTPGPSAPAGGL